MRIAWVALLLGALGAPDRAGAATTVDGSDATADRALTHQVLIGAGATWTDPGTLRHTTYPGALLAFDLGLGKHAAVGLLGDFTYIDERSSGPPPNPTHHRLIAGLDLKFLPLEKGPIRPWLSLGAAGSLVHDTGYGWGVGAGASYRPNLPSAFFVDVHRYRFSDFENASFDQVTLRAGVAF